MKVVGFDFGTTNSLVSIVQGRRVVSFLDEEERPIPSVVCYEGGRKILGREAKRRLVQAGLGVYGNIVRSPKKYLGRDGVTVEGIERSPVEMVADVVGHVLEEARTSGGLRGQNLEGVDGAVVTIPVDMEGLRRRALRDAFKRTGLRIVQFIHEPFAALYGFFRKRGLAAALRRYDGKLLLVFDWGGGTLDLTLCRVRNGTVVQIKNDGTDEVGGDVFDETVMNGLEREVRATRGLDEAVEIRQGAWARLLDRCERGKIDLSSRRTVEIHVPDFFLGGADEDFGHTLDRDAMEEIVGPLLEKGFKRIERILAAADYSSEQVALCLATGGMSNMPAVKRRLHELFGAERVEIPDGTATLVAEGAAGIAADGVGLVLAKNVELLLARGAYLPLVKAGTVMPKEGDVQQENFDLYCTDPRDGTAKFQICAPVSAGGTVRSSDPRVPLDMVTIRVDAQARAFGERLKLDVRIDDDLVLGVHARSLNAGDEDRCEVHELEFGLEFPRGGREGAFGDGLADGNGLKERRGVKGAITIRGNIADRMDDALVPGEFLYAYNRYYFSVQRDPPEEQVYEKTYYEPCAGCGRASNDPACRC